MGGINRIAIFSYLKMQHGSFYATATELSDHLTGFHILPFLHQNLPVVGVSAQITLTVVHNNEVSVT